MLPTGTEEEELSVDRPLSGFRISSEAWEHINYKNPTIDIVPEYV